MKIRNFVAKKINQHDLKGKLLKAYLSSPPKVQFILARFVMKNLLDEEQKEQQELIRH